MTTSPPWVLETRWSYSFRAPYNTDDLEPRSHEAVLRDRDGVELMLVDAHNSIGGRTSSN